MKIVMMPCPGAVGYFRSIQPGAALKAAGHEVTFLHEHSGHTHAEASLAIMEADVVSIVGPGNKITFENRAKPLRETKAIIVAEYDDDPWSWVEDVGCKDPFQAAMTKAAGKTISPDTLATFETWIRGADLVTTTTPCLAEIFRQHGAKSVAVCPNAADERLMSRRSPRRNDKVIDISATKAFLASAKAKNQPRPPRPINAIEDGKRIAWTGSIAHKADLIPCLKALADILATDATVGVVSLGPVRFNDTPEWKDRAFVDQYGSVAMTTHEGVSNLTVPFPLYYTALEAMDADVALIPMRDSPFNRSKSDVTLLSWAMQRVAVVCSRTGEYARREEEGYPAVFVDHDDVDGWKAAIRDLVYEPSKAKDLADKAYKWVSERRSITSAVKVWEASYKSAVECKLAAGR